MKIIKISILSLLTCLIVCGCAKEETAEETKLIPVVLEENEGFRAAEMYMEIKRGSDAVFTLEPADGYMLEDVGYPDYTAAYSGTKNSMTLTLHQVEYPTVVPLEMEKSSLSVRYDANGGCLLGESAGQAGKETEVTIPVIQSHPRVNTSVGTDIFSREGYTLTGWNTMPDGSGQRIGLGSRITYKEGLILYAQWAQWAEEEDFFYEIRQNQAVITGFKASEECLVIPGELGGYMVISIAPGAFSGLQAKTVICPLSLQVIEEKAFSDAGLEELYLYDNIRYVTDYSFSGCSNLKTLCLNAAEDPVYSGTYFDTFADKYDRLLMLKESQKIVLFSGSSARFGYDSAVIDHAFPDYEVVNVGVFAYTNASPQLMLILDCMKEGDVLLHSPEFDAAKRQFCTTKDMDDEFFCMAESNYDLAAQLDLRMFRKVFSALYSYLETKSTMTKKSYHLSPADYDEEGNPVSEKSYNEYGDYILYRPNSSSEEPVFGLSVDYTVSAYPKEQFIDPVNEMYRRFLDKGVQVYFTYAPRNRLALSEKSTPGAREELNTYLRDNLAVPVISKIEDSLYSGIYLNGTDNHLSTEGVAVRTERIVGDLKKQMAAEGTYHE